LFAGLQFDAQISKMEKLHDVKDGVDAGRGVRLQHLLQHVLRHRSGDLVQLPHEAGEARVNAALQQTHAPFVLLVNAVRFEEQCEDFDDFLSQMHREISLGQQNVEQFTLVGLEKEQEDLVAFCWLLEQRGEQIQHFGRL
jgi:hypothetical protein